MTKGPRSMKTAILSTAAVLAIALWAPPAEALSCRNRLVLEGDASARVLELCGDPVSIVQREVTRSRSVQRVLPDGRKVDIPDNTPLHTEYLLHAVAEGHLDQATLDSVLPPA